MIVDVSGLEVAAESAWAVFTSARWHVTRWPEVPLVLVCRHVQGRSALQRNGVTRYVPVFSGIEEAVAAVAAEQPLKHRRRAKEELPAERISLCSAREMVEQWLTAWSREELIPVAKIVVTAFVENVLQHTRSAPSVRLEASGETVTVAVGDENRAPAVVREHSDGPRPSGLKIVASLCRMWGWHRRPPARRSGRSSARRTDYEREYVDSADADGWTGQR